MQFTNSPHFVVLQNAITQSDIPKIFASLNTLGTEFGASDIHIEPYETYCRIRIRIDGVMQELTQYPKTIHDNIIAKFKIESWQMRPDEKRVPQDARVSTITLTNKEIDLRANTLPTVWWEKLVMRIVDKSKTTPPLDALGIEWTNKVILDRNLSYPHGVILTTGPTGSGKTTTLYACLNQLNQTGVNILTYEDPVENRIDWLNQSQVRSDIGFTFAQGLRGSLRQDPDIVMVGEIRDRETLDTAMEAAMTGHLVFSTIHTNSSVETITRVMNLWAKSYQICGTFNLVMAQRLCRKVCDQCSTLETLHEESDLHHLSCARASLAGMDAKALEHELVLRGITADQWKQFEAGSVAKGTGQKSDGTACEACNGEGYHGRVGIYETMEYTDDIKNLLLQGKTAFEVEKFALDAGMINLERDGIFKLIKGQTTLSEIYRIVKHRA